MINEAFCIKCSKKQQINNPKLETTSNGKSIIKGICSNCNTPVATIVPSNTSQADIEKEVNQQKKEKEKEIFEQKQNEVDKFVEKSKLNKDVLKEHGYIPPMRRSYYNLWRIAVFLLAVIVAVLVFRTIYPEEFLPVYNSTMVCENTCPEVPTCPVCPTCPDCSNVCNFPSSLDIDLNLINETE